MTDSKFVFEPVIDAVVKEFWRRRRNLPEDIRKMYEATQITPDLNQIYIYKQKMDYAEYISELYQSLIRMKSNILITYIYNHILGNSYCSEFELIIRQDLERLYLHVGDNIIAGVHLKELKQYQKSLNFCQKIVDLSKDCQFFTIKTTIVLGNEGHSNIIFCERVNDKIILNYYEPHGHVRIKIAKMLERIFRIWNVRGSGGSENLDNLTENANHPVFVLNYATGNVVGAQTEVDNIGYCVMFSLFWIYVVLKIIKYNLDRNSYIPSTKWINEVEDYYLRLVSPFPDKFFEIIITFAITMFNDSIASLPEKERKKILRSLKPELPFRNVSVESKEVESFEMKEENDKPDYGMKRLTELAEEDPEYTYESWEKERRRENVKMKQAWNDFKMKRAYKNEEYTPKLRLGMNCLRNSDCESRRCKHDIEGAYCAAPLRSSRK